MCTDLSADRDRIEDRFAQLTTKDYMKLDESVGLCLEIGRRIARLSHRPELAVGLANGGILPAIVAAQAAGIECRIVRVSRKSSRLKRRLGFLKRLLRLPPSLLGSRPIAAITRRFDRTFNQIERDGEPEDFGFEVTSRHVVIVDDCIDSGSSVAHVRDQLLAKGAASVQVAVISWATKYDSQAMHSVTPDIHLHRIIHYYPWAMNNPDYGRFEAWVNGQGLRLWK